MGRPFAETDGNENNANNTTYNNEDKQESAFSPQNIPVPALAFKYDEDYCLIAGGE